MKWMSSFGRIKRTILSLDMILFLGCILIFLAWPHLDLVVSQHFYDAAQGGFYLRNEPALMLIYHGTRVVGVAVLLITTGILAVSAFSSKVSAGRKKASLYLLAVLFIGSGLVVNWGLKNHWDRPRPRQVIEFGGDHSFEPAFSPRFECDKCHSFVSGHASVGFFFLSLYFLFGKKKWLLPGLLAGFLIGGVRLAQGGHFLSDVLFSGWAMWFVAKALYFLMYRWKGQRAANDAS